MKNSFYDARLKETDRQLARLHRKLSLLSLGRICSFLAFLAGFLLGYFTHFGFYFLGGGSLLLFVSLVCIYSGQKKKERFLLAQKQALNGMLSRKTDGWRQLSDNGAEFINESCPPRGKDLDIFGENSLYQYLSRCHTLYGRQELASRLRTDAPDWEIILKNQQAVKELSQREEFCLRLETLGILMEQSARKKDGETVESFTALSEQSPPSLPVFWKILMWILPFITLFFLISAIIGIHSSINLGLGFMGVLLQLLAAGICWNRNNRILAPLLDFAGSVAPYGAVFAQIESEPFQSKSLQSLQGEILGAAAALKALSSVATAVEARYGHKVRRWLTAVGELEAHMSLAVPANTRREFVFPDIEKTGPQIMGNNIKHPLLPEETAVGNSISLTAQTCVITGSNMSGKTTFLRSIGLNLILAYAGAPVAAASFSASPMKIFTSMRVEDNVSQGISTFYAELLRIKDMVQFSEKKAPMICLIDEIFKGTNSADRIVGATETIRRLSVPHGVTLVSTHDFELCNLENDPRIRALNFHFSDHYTDGGIRFDYKMAPGRCTTTNARYLLKMAGIL